MKLFWLSAFWAAVLCLPLAAQAEFSFARTINTPYPGHNGVAGGSLAIGDFNGDGLKDILVSGLSGTAPATLLYLQKKSGGFEAAQKPADHGIPAMDRGVVLRLGDMDGDGDLDVVAFGRTGVAADTALFKVWKNEGGKFSPLYDLGVELPLEDFADVPGAWGATAKGDNKTDAATKGLFNSQGWSKGVLELADFNGDGKLDIAFAGSKGIESGTDASGQMIQRDWETSGVFLNQGNGAFTYLQKLGFPKAGFPLDPEKEPERSASGLPKVQRGSSVSGDFNRDGKMDIVMWGQANTGSKANPGIPETQRNGQPLVELCLGNGDGSFRVLKETGLRALIDCSATAIDLNGDGNLDLGVLGSTGAPKDPAGGRFIRIYLGKGDGTFTEDSGQIYDRVPNSPDCIVPAFNGDLAFGDLDGDGALDLVVGGNTNDKSLYVYKNVNGNYRIVDLDKLKQGLGSNNIQGLGESDAVIDARLAILDLDGDGDQDLVVNGVGGSMQLLVFSNKLK